jgi:hypothetical protein
MRLEKPFADIAVASRACLLAAAFLALPRVATYAADLNQGLKLSAPLVVAQASGPKATKSAPQASPVAPKPTGSEIVGKMLADPPSDPDVPLPQRGLSAEAPSSPSDGPQIYGRKEEGGGVLGFKIPIPAERTP